MRERLLKIPDNLSDDGHREMAQQILDRDDINGLFISCSTGGVEGPTWDMHKEYDLSFLGHYKGIEALAVDLPKLQSIEPVANLKESLQIFSLSKIENSKVSMSPIGLCENLEQLSLGRNEKDFDQIANLGKLKELGLGGCQDSQLEVISAFEDLRRLYLGFGTCRSLRPLSTLKRLEELDILWVKRLDDISVIGEFTELKYIRLDSLKQVSSIPQLKEHKKLKTLICICLNGLESLEGLIGSHLEELAVTNSRIDARLFEPIAHRMPNLKRVVLDLRRKRETETAEACFDDRQLCETLVDFVRSKEFHRPPVEYYFKPSDSDSIRPAMR
jgi:hypothetical protein